MSRAGLAPPAPGGGSLDRRATPPPRDAYLSHVWYEFDLNGLIILAMEKPGLVTDVVHVSKAYVERMEGSKPT